MKTNGSSWALGALVALGLTAGVAYAAETRTVSVPGGDDYTVVAVLVPGSDEAVVYATRGDSGGMETVHFEFSVRFDPNEQRIYVNGENVSAYDPSVTHTIIFDCVKVGGQWVVNTDVSACGETIASQSGHLFDGADEVVATAESVPTLTVN